MQLYNLLLEEELKLDLKAVASELNLSMAVIIRSAVRDFIREYRADQLEVDENNNIIKRTKNA